MSSTPDTVPKPAPATNGTAPHEPPVTFPLDNFRDAAIHLRRPFTPAAVKFKVQATWPKAEPTGGLIVAYIDARLVVERLNLVVPHLWHDEYRPVGAGQMWCDLTVDAIKRSDIGEGTGKGLVSDALKRAAVRFGIGVSLYAIPKMILDVKAGTVKVKQGGRDGKTLEITPKGEALLRSMYSAWLESVGQANFGAPLDHGDVEDHQGDAEADAVVPAGVEPSTGEVIPAPSLPPEDIERIRNLMRGAVDAGALSPAEAKMHLVAEGATDTSSVAAALATLTPAAAAKLEATIAALPLPTPAPEPAGAPA